MPAITAPDSRRTTDGQAIDPIVCNLKRATNRGGENFLVVLSDVCREILAVDGEGRTTPFTGRLLHTLPSHLIGLGWRPVARRTSRGWFAAPRPDQFLAEKRRPTFRCSRACAISSLVRARYRGAAVAEARADGLLVDEIIE